MSPIQSELETLQSTWEAAWPQALAAWSPFVQLTPPRWCLTSHDEKQESLSGSFAMIRLVDHAVVISLPQIISQGLQRFAKEILAHEIGHHVFCPADLTDHVRLLSRIRRGLPGVEPHAPMVANLYADLLINDRLQRSAGLDILGVYQAISSPSQSKLWLFYLRIYELLWSLPPHTLAIGSYDGRLNQDALLGSRLIRSYSRDWLAGAGRFACLCFPYLSDDLEEFQKAYGWCDTMTAGAGGRPDGLTELEEDEVTGAIHPVEDPELSGLAPVELGDRSGQGRGHVPSADSGRKTIKSFRDPWEYAEVLQASGVTLSPREIAVRYYRERALPYLVPFPSKTFPAALDPLPEGLEIWDLASDLDRVDWLGTLQSSPIIIPGVTTRERSYGTSPGSDPERTPFDLYLGVDCSGSMRDPALNLSYPVLAGAVIALSALRAGAKVKVVLSGEPGNTISTEGFIRDTELILRTLTNYLGTGYSFGIHRLRETFADGFRAVQPVHILIVSDYDMFAMLEEKGGGRMGWEIAREAALAAGGGASYVLQLPGYGGAYAAQFDPKLKRMQSDGWSVNLVNSMEELVDFARRFSRENYGPQQKVTLPPSTK